MFRKMLVVLGLSALGLSAYAVDMSQIAKSVDLRDGSTVYIFKDGKMAMEDKFGRTVGMKPGQIMETKDGQKIIMHGNEIMRLESILHPVEHRGG